jgi:hypothetical protein
MYLPSLLGDPDSMRLPTSRGKTLFVDGGMTIYGF